MYMIFGGTPLLPQSFMSHRIVICFAWFAEDLRTFLPFILLESITFWGSIAFGFHENSLLFAWFS